MYIIEEHRILFCVFLFATVIRGSDKIPVVMFFICLDLAKKMLQASESSAMYHLVKVTTEKENWHHQRESQLLSLAVSVTMSGGRK